MTAENSTVAGAHRAGRWRRVAVVALAAVVLVVPGGAALAGDSPARVVLPSPVGAPPSDDWQPADPSTKLDLRVFLAGKDPAGLTRTALAVSAPGTAAYAHYLTPAQYRQRFGAPAAQVTKVGGWLTAQGMTVTASNEHYLAAEATVEQASSAFDVEFRAYRQTYGAGIVFWSVAPAGDVSVPAELGADVAAVTGMSDWIPAPAAVSTPAPSPSAAEASSTAGEQDYPCSHWWGERRVSIPPSYGHTTASTQVCGYTPTQMRQAYGVAGSPYTGKGATVAIVLDGRSPTMEADANRFFADHGMAGFAPGQYSENLGSGFDCADWPDGDNPEEALDVETVHIIAPDAKVVFVSAGCSYDDYAFLDAHTRVVDDHLADVVSDSWPAREEAFPPAVITAWELVLKQGAAEGIGMNFASGDYGDGSDDSIGQANVLFPTSDPWATGVGGTSLAIGRDGRPVAEYGWGDNVAAIDGTAYSEPPPGTFTMGSGGGVSASLPEPAYQRGVVPDSLATAGGTRPPRRVVPDVAADAGAFWLVGYTAPGDQPQAGDARTTPSDLDPPPGPPVYSEQAMGGGTSGSSPLLAALEADAKQATGHALGFVNPALYRLAGTGALHDVRPVDPADPPITAGVTSCGDAGTVPCLTTLGEDGALRVTDGFDAVTGIGTPTNAFVTAFRGL